MSTVELDEQEWQQVINLIAQAPWTVANPLLMKIGNQLRTQGLPPGDQRQQNIRLNADGKEAHHGE
jgi:hypothetical protein